MDKEYHPEADETDFLGEKDASLYRGLIGSANWMITLGRFDIAYATNAMARFGMKPRQGHLKAMLRLFGYIKKYQNVQLLVDANYMDWSPYKTEAHDWGGVLSGCRRRTTTRHADTERKSYTVNVLQGRRSRA
jgi:hypothetical protein